MELTAKTLQEVTFGAKVRGYDPAEVDDFIAAVAEGVEELHERLRRATERATRAEAQLAAAPVEAEPAAPVEAPHSASPEISKVWERAVAAAEQAMEEAKAEAQKLLDESRTRADSQLNDARREAESLVSNARNEAMRIADEAEGKLKAEIQRLESSRDNLSSDVSQLANYLEGEKHRLKSHLNDALNAIENYGSDANPFAEPAPSTYANDAAPGVTTASDDWATSTATSTSVSEPNWATTPQENTYEAPQGEQESHDWSGNAESSNDWPAAHATHESETGGEHSDWNESGQHQQEQPWQQEQQPWYETHSNEQETVEAADQNESEAVDDGEAEGDPFLAELRRAVQDDGPLGPRSDNGEGGDDSISDLYASDDDSSGFFRRNK